ncbi:recombinase family protein [Agrococcus versicolor]|uniref:Recombinase family protein n=1 Tax=Agrococcus versicolor TaxID=501482 RepID=A0ABP5MHP8_9MICO
MHAAIYARISRDKAGGGLGVDRQEADCRALAERLGWTVTSVYVDNDISAYSGKPRPQYRAMLDAARAGSIQGVLVWHTDRLHRRVTELEEFVALAESTGLQVQTVTAGTIDLTTASGRMSARIVGAVAQHEVDHARERLARAKQQAAADGKYRGGPRPYGYEPDGVTVREDEAAIVREASEGVLAGRTLAAMARDLNERGDVSATGKPWTYAKLRDVLVRPRNAGLIGRGRVGRGDGSTIVGSATWPALVDEDTWRAVEAVLTDPARRKQRGNVTRWLGSGLFKCGKCGAGMRPAPSKGTHLYRCTASAHLTIHAEQTDAYVLQVLAERVRDPRVQAAMRPAQDDGVKADRARRRALSARLADFERDYQAGDITGRQLRQATEKAEAEVAAIDGRLAAAMQQSASASLFGAHDPGAALLEAPVDVQRAILAALLVVTIEPTETRGANRWTHRRLRLAVPTD